MRIELLGALQSASGPYGGRANRHKLTTMKDGRILLTNRKSAMTADHDYPLHAWSRLLWIWLDAMWAGLPQNVRAEWGKCSRRTTDLAKSNLDEFRHHNMPRAILGFPALRLPPDRSRSYACYLPRLAQSSRRKRKPSMQVWTTGVMKPEPQPRGEPPVEGLPFTADVASEPHPFAASASCMYRPCPDNTNHCYDDQYCVMPVPFDTQPPYSFFKWHCPTENDPPTRPIWWLNVQGIESLRKWYDDRPWEEIWAGSIECRHGMWGNLRIPWPSAWCVTMTYDCPQGVLRSDGYYWRDPTDGYPRGTWELAGFRDYYGHYDWLKTIWLEPGGSILADPPPCQKPETVVWAGDPFSSFWGDFENADRWAGLTWYSMGATGLGLVPPYCGGPSYANATDVTCCDTGERKGNWWFKITVMRGGQPYTIEYRKPSTPESPGWAGHYFIIDPNVSLPWASPLMLIAAGEIDWPAQVITPREVIAKEVAIFLAQLAVGALLGVLLRRMEIWVAMRLEYDLGVIRRAAWNAKHVSGTLQGAWKCRIKISAGAQAYKDFLTAVEAWNRIHSTLPYPG